MMNYKNSWKNKKVFEAQLALNEKELDQYPFHWLCFLKAMESVPGNPTSILDVGCGCGVFSELCKRHFPDIKYKGLDYAQEAIDLAKNRWEGEWEVKNYEELSPSDCSYDILHAGALLDVLPDADEAFDHLVGLGFENIIFGRMKLVDTPSKSEVYEAYDEIKTYAFYHNITNIVEKLKHYGYYFMFTGADGNVTLLASKKELSVD